jgi:predicted AAA+ superfamily ATPase
MDLNEATVQAELYKRFRALGYRVLVEPIFKEHRQDRSFINPDLAVFEKTGDEVKVIIEVKNHPKDSKCRERKIGPYRSKKEAPTKQLKSYVDYGKPVLYCRGWDDISKVISRVHTIFEAGDVV